LLTKPLFSLLCDAAAYDLLVVVRDTPEYNWI